MTDIIATFCIFFSLGATIYGAELEHKVKRVREIAAIASIPSKEVNHKPKKIREDVHFEKILPRDVIEIYHILIHLDVEPDIAAVKALQISSMAQKQRSER